MYKCTVHFIIACEFFQPTDASSACLSRRRSEDAPLSFRERSMVITIIIIGIGVSTLIMIIYFKLNIRKYERWNYVIKDTEGKVNERNEISYL